MLVFVFDFESCTQILRFNWFVIVLYMPDFRKVVSVSYETP